MKLSYYGYCFAEVETGKKQLMSIQKFVKSFCKYDNPAYKNQFTHGGEHVFILHVIGTLYLFVQTKSNELIKKINYKNISVAEIYDALGSGEMIGFASYVHINDSHLGFASTVLAPRITAFGEFINKILASIGVVKNKFILVPLLHQATKADAVSMPFIGKSTIQINKSNSLFDDIVNYTGGYSTDFDAVDSFEITIKPKCRKNIDKAVKKLVSKIPDDGLEKLIIKAKEDVKESLVDLYIVGKGVISDKVDTKDEKVIAQKIREKMESNSELREKVSAHEQDESIEKVDITGIVNFSDAHAWTNSFSDIQEPSKDRTNLATEAVR